MKAKFNNSILAVLSVSLLMACSSTKNATAQYPNNDDEYYENYEDDETYNHDEGNYDEPSETDVNIDVFVNELSPYGRWQNSPSYGQVWIPYETGFTPYQTRGHWVYTRYGWTWASDYRWGWAPFHYGRWANDPFYGWMWVPGYQWGPAWVGWRTGGDYYGWAPLSPGINISVGFGFGNNYPANNWCFVPRRYIGYRNFNHYTVNRSRNVTIIKNTTIINNTNIYRNTRYATGPNRTEVERYTGRRVNELKVNNVSKPGATKITNNNTVNIYRPQINKKEVTKNEVNINKKPNNNGMPSHNNNNPGQNPRVIKTPEKRNDNNYNRKPDPRDKIDNKNKDINNERDNDIRNKPPQPNDNRIPQGNRDYNNRNEQQKKPDTKKPPSNWDNRSNDQSRNNGQRPDYYNNKNNSNKSRTWQPPQQQQQKNAPAKPATQQRESKKRPA